MQVALVLTYLEVAPQELQELMLEQAGQVILLHLLFKLQVLLIYV